MKKSSGYLLISLGLLHVLVGIASGWPQIKMIIDQGIWNALGQQSQNTCMNNTACLQMNTIWWFISWGLMLVLFGSLCIWIETSLKCTVPRFIAWMLLTISAISAFLIPASGFWLVIAVAVYMLLPAGHKRRSMKNLE